MATNRSSDRSWFHAYNIALLILTFLGCWWVYKGLTDLQPGDDALAAGCSLIAMVLVAILLNVTNILRDIREKLEKIQGP
mgnify:FL=1